VATDSVTSLHAVYTALTRRRTDTKSQLEETVNTKQCTVLHVARAAIENALFILGATVGQTRATAETLTRPEMGDGGPTSCMQSVLTTAAHNADV